ncbi:MAG TPA: AraC family transcriptional regulator [Rhizomicrobium sp.]
MSESTVGLETDGARPTGAGDIRFSTETLPARHRVDMFREVFARNVLGMDVETLGERPFRTDMCIRQLPGLNIVWARNSPVRASRTPPLLADGKDGFAFQWSASPGFGERGGREIRLEPNDGILIACCEPGVLALPRQGAMVSLTFPNNALSRLLPELADCAGRPVPASSAALRLLAGYVDILRREAAGAPAELQHLAVAHVYDLLALALCPMQDAAKRERRRGVRAARLAAVQKDIAEKLHADITIESIASRHRLSSRHVQRLFEEAGTTFTECVRDARLKQARSMLLSPRFAHKRISDIAFECGFRDLSHFNRWFRARFDASPSDLRNTAARLP